VAEFMRRIGSEAPDAPAKREAAIAGVRLDLLLEELRETTAAQSAGDAVEAADGFADMKYVVVGAAVAYGLPMRDLFLAPREPKAVGPLDALALARKASMHLGDVASALESGDLGALGWALKGLDAAVSTEAAACGFPLRELFAEVHASNMTKEAGYRIGAAKYGPGGGKGPGYRPPDIAGVLLSRGWPPGLVRGAGARA